MFVNTHTYIYIHTCVYVLMIHQQIYGDFVAILHGTGDTTNTLWYHPVIQHGRAVWKIPFIRVYKCEKNQTKWEIFQQCVLDYQGVFVHNKRGMGGSRG